MDAHPAHPPHILSVREPKTNKENSFLRIKEIIYS
jgi:hypothetical protein